MRVPIDLGVEITRSRPLTAEAKRVGALRQSCFASPARPALSNQAPNAIEQPEKAEIVEGCDQQQGKQESEPPPKRPFDNPFAGRTPANRLDSVKDKVTAIQHRDWEKVDESQINREECDQLDELVRTKRRDLAGDLRHAQRTRPDP